MSAARSAVDPSFPQLEVALDPEAMRQVLQGHLRPLGGGVYQIRECRISYVHHLAARRCLVHYDLRLWEPDTGGQLDQLVTGVMYSGNKTRRIWEETRRSDAVWESYGASFGFAPFSYVPELDMLVQVFPYDHGLPALPGLLAGPSAELEALLLARFGPGDWRAESWNVETLRYRAVQRAALRLTARARDAASGRTEQRRFYAKVYLEGEKGGNLGGEQTYRALEELWDKAGSGEVAFTVGRPIAYLDGLRTLLQEEAPGTSLRQHLGREEEAIPAVRQAARALADLHLNDDVVVAQRRRLADEVRRLERAGKQVRSACPRLGPQVDEIVGVVAAGLEEVPLSPVHGDLKPAHILLDGDRVAFIDFDKFAMADPMLDVANLSFALGAAPMDSPYDDRSGVIARAFVEEYFARVPESWRPRLPLYYAMAVVKKAARQLRKQSPGWPDKVEALFGEARGSLSGKIWP